MYIYSSFFWRVFFIIFYVGWFSYSWDRKIAARRHFLLWSVSLSLFFTAFVYRIRSCHLFCTRTGSHTFIPNCPCGWSSGKQVSSPPLTLLNKPQCDSKCTVCRFCLAIDGISCLKVKCQYIQGVLLRPGAGCSMNALWPCVPLPAGWCLPSISERLIHIGHFSFC